VTSRVDDTKTFEWQHKDNIKKSLLQKAADRRNAGSYDASIFSNDAFFFTDKRQYYREEYLKSAHWEQLRANKLEHRPICELCNIRKSFDVHHINYRSLFDVTHWDLVALCRKCHTAEHVFLSTVDTTIWNRRVEAVSLIIGCSQGHFENLLAAVGVKSLNSLGLLTPKNFSAIFPTRGCHLALSILHGKGYFRKLDKHIRNPLKRNKMTTCAEEIKQRIVAAAAALDMPVEDLKKVFVTMGLTNDDFDDEYVFRFNDFQAALGDRPIVKTRKAFGHLRGKRSSESSERTELLKTAFGIKPSLDNASLEQLLAFYDVNNPQDPITVALKKRFGDKKVLIMLQGTDKVDIAATVQYVGDLERGLVSARDLVPDSTGTLVEPQAVGEAVNVVLDEDPLFPGSPLRQDVSVVNHRNWRKVTFTNRQFCRIILDRGEVDAQNREAALNLIERAQAGVEALREAFPEAYVDFVKRVQTDELPRLKMRPGQERPNHPFKVGNRKY
jgi:hypothetical protein